MKRDFKIWSVILAIAILGTVITSLTKSYVGVQRQQMAESYVSDQPEIAFSGEADSPKALAAQPEAVVQSEAALAAQAAGGIAAFEGLPESTDTIEPASSAYEEVQKEKTLSEPLSETLAAEGEPLITEKSKLLSEEVPEESAEPQMLLQDSRKEDGGAAAEDKFVLKQELEEWDYHKALAEYPERLSRLDAQIEQMRSSETDNTVQSVKSAAQIEQRIWEGELDGVYSLLMESLEEEEGSKLRASQQQWIEERDSKALEASKKSSGASMESVEYITSVTASTRARVYELVKQYQ